MTTIDKNAAVGTLTIDGREVPFGDERNLLEVIRGANIDIPTFCYHSELSVYGACRLCMVEIEGRGMQTSCSTKPEAGMVVRTNTQPIRDLRKIAIELVLANHDCNCTTCPKNGACQLQNLAKRFGIDKIRYKSMLKETDKDTSTVSLVRDPNKCVLCGDCVRYCHEVQGIGAIDFVHRGSNVSIQPAYGKDLNLVECVHCGQCARVCPTGAITVKRNEDMIWDAISNPEKVVIAQIAPAVRVAIGEYFGMPAGEVATGQAVAALKSIGFDKVFDTSFSADLTVIEEATEFLGRVAEGKNLPQFTSCCPAWVKYAEQYYPSVLPHLSSCKSPQQMFGSVARDVLPKLLNVKPENLVIVSIMPCTAKKFEAGRPEFEHDGIKDVDVVLTTQELGHMVETAGISFNELQPESLDMPLGFKTGAGVIFGTTGGVSEAVLRFAVEKVSGQKLESYEFKEVRGDEKLREVTMTLGGKELRLAVVHGLAEAGKIADQVAKGDCKYDLIEVMSCPGGCIGGAGQPVTISPANRKKRTKGLYEADKMLQLHKSQDNHMVRSCYENNLGEVGGEKAHHLLHTHYKSRRRIEGESLDLSNGIKGAKVKVSVCVGTSCHVRGSQDILRKTVDYINEEKLADFVDVKATFCFERCGKSPNAMVGDELIEGCTVEKLVERIDAELADKVKD